jgi:hypothetical protein
MPILDLMIFILFLFFFLIGIESIQYPSFNIEIHKLYMVITKRDILDLMIFILFLFFFLIGIESIQYPSFNIEIHKLYMVITKRDKNISDHLGNEYENVNTFQCDLKNLKRLSLAPLMVLLVCFPLCSPHKHQSQ